eukprot:jgi/Bigna1/137396/aug1.39_g12104
MNHARVESQETSNNVDASNSSQIADADDSSGNQLREQERLAIPMQNENDEKGKKGKPDDDTSENEPNVLDPSESSRSNHRRLPAHPNHSKKLEEMAKSALTEVHDARSKEEKASTAENSLKKFAENYCGSHSVARVQRLFYETEEMYFKVQLTLIAQKLIEVWLECMQVSLDRGSNHIRSDGHAHNDASEVESSVGEEEEKEKEEAGRSSFPMMTTTFITISIKKKTPKHVGHYEMSKRGNGLCNPQAQQQQCSGSYLCMRAATRNCVM